MKGARLATTANEAQADARPVRYAALCSAVLLWGLSALLVWLGAIALCPNGACRAPEFDRQFLDLLHTLRQPWLDAFFAAVTWLGSIAVLLPVALAMAWRFRQRGRHLAAMMPLFAVAGAWLLVHLCKLLIARPRPDIYPALIPMPADFSYPSAHAMQITAFALACVLAPGLRPGWRGCTAAALLILVVALSRLYLQVHFPSDVLFGLMAGAGWVFGLRLLLGAR